MSTKNDAAMDTALTLAFPSDRETVIIRVFNAPRRLVFDAWTKPEHVRHWYGLGYLAMTLCEIDLRPGGAWRYVLQAPDGSEYGFSGVYREIVPPDRLVYTEGYEAMPGADYLVTATFEEQDGKTTLTSRLLYKSQEHRDGHVNSGMEPGMIETLNRLDEHLIVMSAAEREIVITRIFDAPRSLVWKAWTDPQHVMRWWGPKAFTAPACRIDLQVGGVYLFCMRSPDGQDYWNTGVYREIVPFERIVYTDSFADEHGNPVPATHYGMGADLPFEMTITVTFEDLGGKTKMTLRHADFPAGEMSDLTKAGWNESFDKLAESLR